MKIKREKHEPAVSWKSTFALQAFGECWVKGDALVLGASTLETEVISDSKMRIQIKEKKEKEVKTLIQ